MLTSELGIAAHPEGASYFHGRINRDEAEVRLINQGSQTGLFLLRESAKKNGHYAISVCFDNLVYHYCIEPQEDGSVILDKMIKFPGPVEVVDYYKTNQGGLVCKLQIPCCNFRRNSPIIQVSDEDIEKLMKKKASEWGIEEESLQFILTEYRSQFKLLVKQSIHEYQPWFHGIISRIEAERRLMINGHVNGKFLIREREDHSFALCLSYNDLLKHYKIDVLSDNKIAIDSGKSFENIMELVEHYAIWKDGLWCELTVVCDKEKFDGIIQDDFQPKYRERCVSTPIDAFSKPIPIARSKNKTDSFISGVSPPATTSISPLSRIGLPIASSRKYAVSTPELFPSKMLSPEFKPIPKPRKFKSPLSKVAASLECLHTITADGCDNNYKKDNSVPILISTTPKSDEITTPQVPPRRGSSPKTIDVNLASAEYIELADTEEPAHVRNTSEPIEINANTAIVDYLKNATYDYAYEWKEQSEIVSSPTTSNGEDPITIFKQFQAKRKEPFNFDRNRIVLHEKLGSGYFGHVMRGTFKYVDSKVDLAIKILKTSELPTAVNDILKEARNMSGLDHPNIVRLIGCCTGEPVFLILELAPLGPLNKYLRKNKSFAVQNILQLMLQVARGMEYLSCVKFIHRDLAARNVLLVNEYFAKISDFGMSQALGLDSEYYKAREGGRWPLKWYAPECIYYFKFTLKSDVWSYGVTLWEALTYGQKPYQGMNGTVILQLLEEGGRLNQPKACSDVIYKIMLKCWSYDAKDRPTFSDLVRNLSQNLLDPQSLLPSSK